ncbi:MAG TPA: hypothetical protein VHB78_12130, partial [Vicinamibacterales bacterium]|nr:hypothetical protein [Vicinamibacterales bacterium]
MSAPTPTRDVNIEAEYERRLADRRATLAAADRRHVRVSRVRLAIVAAAIVMVIAGGLPMLPWLLVPFVAFLGVAAFHGTVLNARDRAASAVAFYERGLARIRHAWIGQGRPGDEHRQADHVFADDLDIFGRGSLFELLATTRTRAGEETLVRWLLSPVDAAEARSRQAAVRELAARVDLREAIAVLGDQTRTAVDAPVLRAWAQTPVRLHGRAIRFGLALLAASTIASLAIWLSTGALRWAVLICALLEGIVTLALRPRVDAVVEAVADPAHDLDVLAGVLRVLEDARFESPRLEQLRLALNRGRPASSEIATLSRFVALLESHRNVVFAFPAALMLWTTQWAFVIEAWRARVGRHIPEWLDLIGEIEALIAIGGFAAEHPDFVYPDVVEDGPTMAATALAHPTLPADAVANDVALGDGGLRLLIVSGSNMSGKSTWLRTIGTTVVLSWLGAPVRATACRVSPLAIGAAIRANDSLLDGRSRFFAEITRLKQIVDLVRASRGAVLFLLDEILGGTNSHDRRAGAEALLTGLVDAGAIGLATTHDL